MSAGFGQVKIHERGGACRLSVKVVPRSSKTQLAGVENGELKVRVSAPPVEGEANGALLDFLAKLLRIPKSALEVVKGAQSRHKVVQVAGLGARELLEKLEKQN